VRSFDLWQSRKTAVTLKDGSVIEKTYPHWLVFFDDRKRNRAERRATASDERSRSRGPKKRAARRAFDARDRTSRRLLWGRMKP
jgi:hypothetical protein